MKKKDWTSQHGVANSSQSYLRLVDVVEGILLNHRLSDDPAATARLIMSSLTHGHGMAPTAPKEQD